MGIDVRISDAISKGFLDAVAGLSPKDFRPEFNAMGRWMRDETVATFRAETDPYGNPWAPLARSTIAEKTKKGAPAPELILVETGEMANSFQYRALVNGVRVFNNRVFDDGTTAEIHQEGGTHPVGKNFIPARPMLPDTGRFPEHWAMEIEKIIGEGITRVLG